jgi:hypothetical protein
MAIVLVAALVSALVISMHMPLLVVAVIVLAVFAMLASMLIHTALTGIYAATLYRFADQGSSGLLDDEVLRTAFLPK